MHSARLHRFDDILINRIDVTLFVALVLLILTRFAVTYLNAGHQVRAPESYFAWESVGHDWFESVIVPAQQIREGNAITPYGYGYAFPVIFSGMLSVMERIGACTPSDLRSCGYVLYGVAMGIVFAGYAYFPLMVLSKRKQRWIAGIALLSFFVGVPAGRGIETGNIDVLLALLFGYVLFAQRAFLTQHIRKSYASLLLGAAMGFFINTKLFFIPFALIVWRYTPSGTLYILSLVVTYFLFAMAPSYVGVPVRAWDVVRVTALAIEPILNEMSQYYPHGNNTVWAFMVGILEPFNRWIVRATPLYISLVIIGGILFCVLIFLTPVAVWMHHGGSWKLFSRKAHRYHGMLFFMTVMVAGINTIPIVSFDYRIFYDIPVIIILLEEARTRATKQVLYLSILLLLVKSAWIFHGRFLAVVLYAHYALLIAAALSLIPTRLKR